MAAEAGPSSGLRPDDTTDANKDLEQALFGQLGIAVQEQDDFERDLMNKADAAMRERDDKADDKRLRRTAKELASAQQRLNDLKQKLSGRTAIRDTLEKEVEATRKRIEELKQEEKAIQERMDERDREATASTSRPKPGSSSTAGARKVSSAEERDRLIQLGLITPFAAGGLERRLQQQPAAGPSASRTAPAPVPGRGTDSTEEDEAEEQEPAVPTPRRRLQRKSRATNTDEDDEEEDGAVDLYEDEDDDDDDGDDQDGEDLEQDGTGDEDDDTSGSRRLKRKIRRGKADLRYIDDGNETAYQERLEEWAKRRRKRRIRNDPSANLAPPDEVDPAEEMLLSSPFTEDAQFDKGFRVPGEIWADLFEYQRTGVKWLWELHDQDVGGIIGDEMGLGKTVQIIAFLAGLSNSGLLNGPVLVACPATVLKQWTQEFHKWWAPFRVVILHSSGSGMAKSRTVTSIGSGSDEDEGVPVIKVTNEGAKTIVNTVFNKGHVLVTTYESVKQYRHLLLKRRWGYVILDEGHKIRNPDAEITLTCKQLLCNHRILMTGTPIQNNLIELWSLMDFVFPGRLGTLPVFQNEFAIPIRLGGYANASNIQVQAAYRCATVLRDLITPYLLRRLKVNVASQLPKKTEQVLFCSLTPTQRKAYERYLKSGEVRAILSGKRHVLSGIDQLRKICNHPDLTDLKRKSEIEDYGTYEKSGKLVVVKALLETWHATGHRVLLFCQTRQMCDILEKFVSSQNYKYMRMDGGTAIGQRSMMVDEFNSNPEYFVFLLTTKVGGLGINLQSADRVVIYDPDWNPSTDIQARERAWRIGQKKDVSIYRLMMAGTIEEKIYHRQIFKQFLTNKILKDPKQRRFFKSNDLHDLFTLGAENSKGQTETGEIFADMDMDVEVKLKKRARRDGNELNGIENVAKVQRYQTGPDDANDDSAGGAQAGSSSGGGGGGLFAEDDDRQILQSLFQRKNGVHSALKHDVIMDADNPEMSIVDKEAARIANRAIAALKKSRRNRGSAVDAPTWTGRSGTAGAPGTLRFGKKASNAIAPAGALRIGGRPESPTTSSASVTGQTPAEDSQAAPSSSALLANLRRAAEISRNGEAGSGGPVDTSDEPAVALANKVADFLKDSGGRATSNDVVARFQAEIAGQDIAVFRSLLKGIATKQDGYWVLKEDL